MHLKPPVWFDNNNLFLELHIQPKASTSGYVGLFNHRLKIRLNVPPVDGKANQALLLWLAKEFDVTQSQLSIPFGATSSKKRVRICDPQKFPEWILPWISREV